MPVDKNDHNHPEIVDQFFYHGEPWFTFDQKKFDTKTQFEGIDIKIMDLTVHRIKDRKYCNCTKVKKVAKASHISVSAKTEQAYFTSDYHEIESDIYFQDLYHTYQNFHGLSSVPKHSANSVR